MALALYRKYRPRTFAEVIGQEHVTEPLSQALRSGRLNHAYLFSGPRGCGKTSSARILARSLNCEQGPTPEPCGHCLSCKSLAVDGSGSIDVIEIDAASHGGVDDARELREKAFFAPANSRYKIYVIDEAHMVSTQGFNALLKLVEEPPEYVKFIFATTEPEKVLGTIRSRTHHYPFRLIPPATLRPYLEQLCEAEGVHVDPAVFPLVVRAGGGSARDSLSILDQLIAGAGPDGVGYARAVALLGVTDTALIDEMCDALAAGDGAAAYSTIDRVSEAGHDPRRFASDLLERLRDLIIMQQVQDAVAKGLIDGPTDQMERMTGQAGRLGPATLSRCADIVHNGLVEMRGTTAPRLLLELITARMLLPGAEDSTGALLQRLERMERRITLGDGTAPSAPVSETTPTSAGIVSTRSTGGPGADGPGADDPGADDPGADDPSAAVSDTTQSGRTDPVAAHPATVAVGPTPQPATPPTPRLPDPAAVMPDAQLEAVPPAAAVAAAPGQLSAAGIRDAWPAIVSMVGRKSKKVAALAQGAIVQDLDGQTVVLGFRFPAHARMVAAQPELLADALYEALGGRWQIRCDIAGEGGPSTAARSGAPVQIRPATPAQPGSSQAGAPPAGGTPGGMSGGTPGGMSAATDPNSGAAAHSNGGVRSGDTGPASAGPVDEGGSDWPEPARPGGSAAALSSTTTAATGNGETPGAASPVPAGNAAAAAAAAAAPRTAGSGRAAGATAALAAARAAAAGGAVAGEAVAGGAAAGGAGTRPGVNTGAWSDGSPAQEPPYDPDYDGPIGPGGTPATATIEGFDPGDEPLEDVIDEKTARQSSEQQAVQLLRDAFGSAEKIGES